MHPAQQPSPGALANIAEFQRVYLLSPLSPKIASYDNSAAQGVYIQNPWPINVTGIGPAKSSKQTVHQLLAGPTAGNDYLNWGLARLNETYFYGQCDAFASVVTSLLVAQGSNFLPAGALVEICTVVKTPVNGHTFVLLNRDQNGTLANSASWGVDAVIIDPWYALQVGCPAAFSPLDVHGAGFIAWALQLRGFKATATGVFAVGTYPSIKLPPKYR